MQSIKSAASVNPLVNPIAYGDQVRMPDGRTLTCKTNMRGMWEVYEGDKRLATDLDGQMALCYWIDQNSHIG